ncbi:MAG: hypothetical protein K0M69_13540, partial [Youngiibacter sp.]|nr:hypothetical protein [Youngiibacter sp.]
MTKQKYCNTEAEIELLSRIMMDNKILLQLHDELTPSDFYDPKNQAIYSAMMKLMQADKSISAISLHDILKVPDFPLSLFTEISGVAASTSDFSTYSQIVREHSKKRQLIQLLRNAAKDLETQPHEEVLLNLNTSLYKASGKHKKNDIITDAVLMEKTLNAIEKTIKGHSCSSMKTGLIAIDKPLKNFNKGQLMIIAARPAMGKSALAANLAERWAIKNKVAMISLEMNAEQISYRRLAALSSIPLSKLYAPSEMTEAEIQVLMRNINLLETRNNIYTIDTPYMTLEQLRNKIIFLKETKGVDIVIIDHLQLMQLSKRATSRNDGLGEISAGL